MRETADRAIAIVGTGAVLPDAPNVPAFWNNVKRGRYSITDVTPERWDPDLYWDADRAAPDKTYTKIGGWVREYPWDPLKWRMAIPPRVADAMDDGQRWALAATREALADYGYPDRPLPIERTAVILGNAMGGEQHYLTSLRAFFPEYARELDSSASFSALPAAIRREITREWHARLGDKLPPITEDSMPGELSNCLAGRIANIFNFRGPNFVCDAACASSMAAMQAAVEGLAQNDFDVAVTGGVDHNMGAPTFIKFCKIGALSATGSRPFAEGADGFVMGEGAALFLMKRLEDAERDGDRIYAVLRGIGGASDGKGKGITAPNPVGQKIAIERAWENAGLDPATATLIEGHGTSTTVGDVVEVESMIGVLKAHGANGRRIALGSVKSNIGHLKGAAGAASVLKTALALREKVLPPSVRCEHLNPNIDWTDAPLQVNRELRPWDETAEGVRRAGVSAFGFGGTNFHVVMEEYVPHRLTGNGSRRASVSEASRAESAASAPKMPLRGALVVGAQSASALAARIAEVQKAGEAGLAPAPAAPSEQDLRAPERIAIDYGSAAELAEKCAKARKALESNDPVVWKALRAQGIYRGGGAAPKVAFLYTGQGSQYVNMLRALRSAEPIVARTFEEADRVMAPLLAKPLTGYVYVDRADAAAMEQAEDDLRQTAITQPAVLAVDLALTRLLEAYGIRPDMTMGHSLGEYGALVAAGALPFADALEAVSARGREMARVAMADNGRMAAVFAPEAEIERILRTIEGYAVIANRNSGKQAVIGGASAAVERAMAALLEAGYNVVPLPVSHAFHTSIVAPASEPLRRMLGRLRLQPAKLPIVANVDGEFYPAGADARPAMLDLLARQVASPVQFSAGLRTLYNAGARVFVEVGPKKALHGFVEDVLGGHDDVLSLFTNHPKFDDATAFNQALCGMYAAGLGTHMPGAGQALADRPPAKVSAVPERLKGDPRSLAQPVAITGASLGLPGTPRIFDDGNVARILRGEQFIDLIPARFRRSMLDKHITRLVKSDIGGPSFEEVRRPEELVKLAGRGGAFDLGAEFGIPGDRVAALDRTTQLAIAAGIDALRDAGIPLVMRHKRTTRGTLLPDRWGLPDALRDDTGIVFASVFPGFDSFADEAERYYSDRGRRDQLALLEDLRGRMGSADGPLRQEIERRIADLEDATHSLVYRLDRRLIFRLLSMGHSQFAELIGARGPNTQVNAACASTTQAVAVAEDWIRAGHCRRVIIVAADDVTTDHLVDWFGAAFLASGVAATDDVVEEAAVPFDRRRHGMIIGMGAAALVVESAESAAARGLRPICEVLSTVAANSAFHGTRLDVSHIRNVMEKLVGQAEAASGFRREQAAGQMVFVSHETYTPARGGSASAEINALRAVFGDAAERIVIANTKGFTGHAMGTGIEDVVAVKALETGCVPPVPNFKEVDPELGRLNLSRGGAYPLEYALRLAAGFGSQISMTLLRRVAGDGARPRPGALGYANRIADPAAWRAWLDGIAGATAELEVAHRTLRVRDTGAAAEPVPIATEPVVVAPPVELAAVKAPEDEVREAALQLVSEKTGYPREMLALDLDLEADLGIDTVKQAEMFAAIREKYGIARDPNLKLREFPTLARVIQFVRDRLPDLEAPAAGGAGASAPAAPAAQTMPVMAAAAPAPSQGADEIHDQVLDLVAAKTGYPKDMLDLDLDLEADLGIDTVKQAEMFAAIRETYQIARDPNLKLRDFPTLARVIQFVRDRRPDLEAPAPATAADEIRDKVLDIVSEKTGYPRDMLALDLDLEADLGIDTVKQAEMFAAIRETYRIARDPNLKLRDFPTLGHVIRFARERSAAAPAAAPPPKAEAGRPGVAASFAAASHVPRRVPAPALRPALELCKSTGVSLAAGKRVLVMADGGGAGAILCEKLRARGVEVATGEALLAAGPVDGVYWLPALDAECALGALSPDAWGEAVDVRVKALYRTMRAVGDRIGEPGAFLISATRMGGRHGYDEAGAEAPLGGGVTGFVKAYKRERPGVLVKAVDFEAGHTAAEIADLLLAETLRDAGAVEIGYAGGQRWTVGLAERPFAEGEGGMTLDKQTVFLVTGAAGSIVSAITADLAAASGGTFHLMDLVAEPDAANPDLARFHTDQEGLKRDLFTRIQARGERATPALVERELAAIERSLAARDAIDAVRAAGGTAYYYSLDLTDAKALEQAVGEVRRRSGRVDVLLHAAGIERSHMLADKDAREFDLVFDVKSAGCFHLLRAIGEMPVGTMVAFCSIAGRFGNAGQTDYSAANDLLCKIVSSFRRTRPATRAIAIDWTAWAGIGMASRGSIPKMMEMAGIDMLPVEAGVPWLRRELTASGAPGEVVVAGRLGVLEKEWDEDGGLDASALPRGPMTGRAKMESGGRLTVETPLDPALQPFLRDHAIEGTPLLPGVMGIEAFAEAARSIVPGWHVESLEDVEFLAPFKFYRGLPRAVTVQAEYEREGRELVARCRLLGLRQLNNQEAAQTTEHFTGRVRLGRRMPAMASGPPPGTPAGMQIDAASIYRVYFHGPAYQVLRRAWWNAAEAIGEMARDLPENHFPSDLPLAMAPRLIELCFQTAGLWEMAARHRMGLPRHIDVVWVRGTPEKAAGPLYARVTPDAGGESFHAEVVDSGGARYVEMRGYRTIAFQEVDAAQFHPAEAAAV